jgi:hypothetical protein
MKAPLEEILLLAFKRVFEMIFLFEIDIKWNYTNWNFYTNLKFWNQIRYQLKILRLTQLPIEIISSFSFWKNWKMVVRSFCFGRNTFSPFGINRQKWRRALYSFSPIGKINMSEGSYQLRVSWVTAKDKWYRQSWSGSLVFAEYSISLSI